MIWAWSLLLSYPMSTIVILFQFVLFDEDACCLSQQLGFAVLPMDLAAVLRRYDSHARFAAGLPSRLLYCAIV